LRQLVTIQFIWNGAKKPCSSSFVGVSPEFELALYTMTWFASDEPKNIVTVGPYNVELTAYRQKSRGVDYIGTAFPAEAPLTENEGASRLQKHSRNKKFNKKYGNNNNGRR